MQNFIVAKPEELKTVAEFLTKHERDYPNVWLFKGEMGAGKTTLIKEICYQLNVFDIVSSPTFSLVNEYLTFDADVIYHFDFYRIEDEEEAELIGIEEYFNTGKLCLVEWPEKVPHLLPESNLNITFKINSDNSRTITIEKT